MKLANVCKEATWLIWFSHFFGKGLTSPYFALCLGMTNGSSSQRVKDFTCGTTFVNQIHLRHLYVARTWFWIATL